MEALGQLMRPRLDHSNVLAQNLHHSYGARVSHAVATIRRGELEGVAGDEEGPRARISPLVSRLGTLDPHDGAEGLAHETHDWRTLGVDASTKPRSVICAGIFFSITRL